MWPSRAQRAVDTVMNDVIPPVGGRVVTLWDGFTVSAFTSALWAKQVPAFSRGCRLITGTVAQLPLVEYVNGNPARSPFLTQPEAEATYWETMQRTAEDLLLYGHAYWQILGLDLAGVYPFNVKQLEASDVSEGTDDRTIMYEGNELRVSNPNTPARVGDVIVFEGYDEGVLLTGVETITTALDLELATRNYAKSPAPAQVLKNTSNYELADTEIDDLLLAYETARRAGTVAYLNGGIDLSSFGFDAQQTALVEQKNQSRLAIANLLNLDPSWLGAAVAGSSLTYTNRIDLRTDLYGLTVTDYTGPIEQRLSMRDCAAGVIQFDASAFLRSNLEQRATMAQSLFTAGIITQAEARDFISSRPTGGIA